MMLFFRFFHVAELLAQRDYFVYELFRRFVRIHFSILSNSWAGVNLIVLIDVHVTDFHIFCALVILAAQTLYSGIFATGSIAVLVSILAAASAKWNGIKIVP